MNGFHKRNQLVCYRIIRSKSRLVGCYKIICNKVIVKFLKNYFFKDFGKNGQKRFRSIIINNLLTIFFMNWGNMPSSMC